TTASAQAPHEVESGSFGDSALVSHPSPPGDVGTSGTEIAHNTEPSQQPGATLALGGSVGTAAGPIEPYDGQQYTKTWIAKGYDGTGVKVGVIDYFDPEVLADQIAAGEVQNVPNGRRRCIDNGAECPFGAPGSDHGNAIIEAITDQAPGATLYLVEVGRQSDYTIAVDWLAAQGVTIINHSLVGVYDGPGDGTGTRAGLVDYAISKGIMWVNTAGDNAAHPGYDFYKGGYWRGMWNDPDGDRWLNFSGTDETLGTYCGALMGLRWSDWGAGKTDYELWAGDVYISTGLNATPVLASDYNQATGGAVPLEANDFRWLCNTNPNFGPVYDKNNDGFISLKVKRSLRSTSASATGDRIELQVVNGWFEYSSSPYSAAISYADSRNLGMLAVTGQDLPTASQGPTNDNRFKPDVVAPGCVNTMVYGPCEAEDAYFAGDMAAAVVSGVAAVVLDGHGTMEPWQLAQFMRSNAAYAGNNFTGITPLNVTPNNTQGHGQLRLRSGPALPMITDAGFRPMTATRLIDTRQSTVRRPTTQPLPPGSTLAVYVPGDGGSDASRTLLLNVTLVSPTVPGWVQVLAGSSSVPGRSSNLNVEVPGQTLPNLVVTTVGADDTVLIYNRAGGHVVVDLVGTFEGRGFGPPLVSGFAPLDTYRAYDSRCSGCTQLPANTVRNIALGGTGSASNGWQSNLPASATVAVVNVTVDNPTAAGFFSVVPTSVQPPMPTSTANFAAGKSITRTSFVELDDQDRIRVYSSAATHFQVDLVGYFGGQNSGGLFNAVAPTRVVDTRSGGAPAPTAAQHTTVDISAIAPFAGAILGNLTSTHAATPGELRLGRNDTAADGVHRELTLPTAGQTSSSGVISAVDDGQVVIAGSTTAHRILDISGYFAPVWRLDEQHMRMEPEYEGGPNYVYNAVLSPDGDTVVSSEEPRQAALRIWDLDTDEVEVVDILEGKDDVNFQLLGVSSDGDRIGVCSFDPLTDEDVNGVRDCYVFTMSTGVLARVSHAPGGGAWQQHGPEWFDAEITKLGYTTSVPVLPSDLDVANDFYVLDLATDVTTLHFKLNNDFVTPAPDFSAGYSNTKVYREGQTTLTVTGSPLQISPDGAAVLVRYNSVGVGYDYSLLDTATGTSTALCTGTELKGKLDLSEALPTTGAWCAEGRHHSGVGALVNGEWFEPISTWNG
ncbi:MAG TPA: S8 family serine peptidase, partial [Ilumatobacteraceae bacterium]|nr:S8 family serine peptidase [Ilumatobacteraceae bacterium]